MLIIISIGTLFILQATICHAFVPNKRLYSMYAPNSARRALTIETFSVIPSDSSINLGSNENEKDTRNPDQHFFLQKLTSEILTDYDEDDISRDEDDQTTLTTSNVLSLLLHHSRQETVEGAKTIEKILDRLEDRFDRGRNHLCNVHCGHYTIAVTAWAKSGHPDSAERATRIVDRMKKRNIEMNAVTYNNWMNAYVIQDNFSKVEEIMLEMEERIPSDIRVKDYNVLILAKSRQGLAKDAEQIVKSMVDRYSSGKSSVLPDLITYSILLDAWSKSGEEGRGVRAETILDSIEERQISFDTTVYKDSDLALSNTYVAAMRAIVHSGENNIAQRVENIYKRLIERGITHDSYVYSTLLDAYATASPVDISERITEILTRMEENVGDTNLTGTIVVYNTALKLLKESREPNAIDTAEELFQKMKTKGSCDQVTYGTMIALYTDNCANNSYCMKRTEELLNEIINENGLDANTHHMNSAMNCFIRAGDIPKAVNLLERMEDEYNDGNEILKPNVVSYATLMNGWVKSNDPQKEGKTIMVFDRMMAMYKSGNKAAQPNFVTYVTLVDCLKTSGGVGAAEQAEEILRSMYQSYKLGASDFKPNAHLISTVIDLWSKSGDFSAGERAEMLLHWLFELYKEEKDPELMPSAHPFASSISAWAKSRKFGKATRAKAILDKMKSSYTAGIIKSPPNIYCYTAVINACAHAERDSIEKRDALQVFLATYKAMMNDKDVVPNNVTFATVLTALRNLLPADDKRTDATRRVFQKCVDLGMCNITVTQRLQSLLSTEQLKDLIGDERVDGNGAVMIELVPKEWSQHVQSKPKKKCATNNGRGRKM
eukprot:CAMPEP_0197179612 /NCGR_PEP_ID=MMETSP1423-20130617/4497_1 /TAXON_ID=476441 /ORGANISM="Pseudo-nitzschia heimii, Strain UNC1101" /LENGTH=831 /DNA_ID=CAMNT_0042629539 /DNA_START=162 /DNA_END=2657 /DNA_ORIENTATION=+